MSSSPTVARLARAKLNLFLRVLDRRPDGYHDLESLVVPVSLADDLNVSPADRLHVEILGAPGVASRVPAGGLNLALVSALALADACDVADGAEITIEKRIPVAGGLGGGSADAAAAMSALNELWGCGLDRAALAGIAARVGSDVPAALAPGAVLMRGRGDRIEDVDMPETWWTVVPMPFGVRSPDAYRWWDSAPSRTGGDPAAALEAARRGDLELLGSLLFNDLERPVVRRHPEIGAIKDGLIESGALGAVMSGSGSSVVGLARDRTHARELASAFEGAIAAFGPAPDR